MDVQKEEVQKVESELLKAEESLELEIAKTEGKDNYETQMYTWLTGSNHIEFKRSLSEQEAEIKKLEEECSNVNQRLSKDPDFVRFALFMHKKLTVEYICACRLQRELEFCKACPEEAECDAASRQLSELQQKCYYHQMKRQLDRQKNSIQNKSLDSERRPGHYNPYTCQYVPAPPKSSANNSFNEGCWNNAVLRPNSNNSGFRRQSNKHKEEFPEEEDVKLVDDEWLMIGEVEHLDDDGEWDVESLQDEIEDDNTIMDEDWDDFDAPPNASATRKHHQFSSHDSNDVKNLTTSHAQSASTVATKTTKSKCLSSQSQTMPPVTKAIDVTMSQPKHKLQRNVILSEETPSRPIRVAPPRSSTMAHWNKVSRKPMNRSSNEAIIPSDVLIVDSPDPNCVLRKRSGQSIYKAPGSKPNCDRYM